MTFQISWQQRPNSFGIDDRVVVLQDSQNLLEVWPALGLNAFRWQVAGQELLYRHPEYFTDNRPTRSGLPILFPFPNRIHAGRFTWEGRSYQLPVTDPAKKNAIHGFVFKKAWHICDQGADTNSAWVQGEFHGSRDAPETLAQWPADYRLRVTYRLYDHILRVEAEVVNPDTKALPFGIGYHPYFALAPFADSRAILTLGAEKMWELIENLPTGRILDVDEARDVRHGRSYSGLQLDDVMTDLHPFVLDHQDHLNLIGVIQHPSGERLLTLWAAPDFRELVLFTPPHREAICLEPYTCTTDAINLVQRHSNTGLRILQPGQRWQAAVELHLSSSSIS